MSFRFSLPKALSFLISLNAFSLTTGSTSGRISGSLSVAGEDCFLLIVRDGSKRTRKFQMVSCGSLARCG
jgi:hypothetical protein